MEKKHGEEERKKWHEGLLARCLARYILYRLRIKPSMQKELKDRRAYREKTGNVSPYRGTRPHRRQML